MTPAARGRYAIGLGRPKVPGSVTSEPLLVLTTCESSSQAQELADALVSSRLAACVNTVDSVSSTYRWAGKVERGKEFLLLIKTTEERLEAIEERIKTLSAYDLPEVVAVRIQAGSSDYLDWLGSSVRE